MAASEQKLNKIFDQNVQITGDLTVDGNLVGYSGDNFYLDGITKSGNTLTFSVNGAANQSYTFGSAAFANTTAFAAASHSHDYLSNNSDSEQTVGSKINYFNVGGLRMNMDPRWNEGGYDGDNGNLHIWSTRADGGNYGRAGIALYNGSAYQYLTTKGGQDALYHNNSQIITSATIGSQSVSYAANAGLLDGLDSSAFMRDDGWNTSPGQDANTQTGMRSDFSYSNNAPHTGDLIRFGSSGYSLQLSSQYGGSGQGFSFRTRNGDTSTWNPWYQIIHAGNIGSQSVSYATNAGTLDGIDSSQFLRSDASDTFTGNYLGFSGLSLGIANNNSDNGYGTYFRGNSTHFVLGLTNGNTLYMNYGNSSGTMRTYGTMNHEGNTWMNTSRHIYSPIYYDDNNTAYYTDPASTSNIYKLIVNTADTGVTRQLTIKEASDSEISMGSYPGAWTSALNIQSNDGSTYLWMSPLTSNIPRIQTNYGQIDFYTGSNTNRALHLSGTSARSSIFYDIDNTGYYTDPASTSNLNYTNGVEFKLSTSSNNGRFNAVGDWGTRFYTDSGYIQFGPANSGHAHIYTDRSNFYFNQQLQVNGGTIINTSEIQSNIYYDKQNTGYYVDPASTSNLSGLSVASQISGSINGASNAVAITGYGNGNFTFHQSSGAFDAFSGWHNYFIGNHGSGASYYHTLIAFPFWGSPRYSRRESGTLRGPYEFWTSERTIDSSYDIYAPAYYDKNDTAYYLNPANTSRLLYTNVNEYRLPNGFTIYQGGSNYGQFNSWVHLPGYFGFYSGNNGAHIYPNNATYGSWRIDGTRNSWGGIHFGTGMTLMMNNTECGFHREGDGWYLLSQNKNLNIPGDVTAYWSDRRLKKNIKPINNGLEKTLALVPCEFEWNEKANAVNENLYDGKKEVSLIAQEVQKIIPNAVTENLSAKGDDEEKYLTIKYDKIVPYLIQAIKEQQEQIDELKKLINP